MILACINALPVFRMWLVHAARFSQVLEAPRERFEESLAAEQELIAGLLGLESGGGEADKKGKADKGAKGGKPDKGAKGKPDPKKAGGKPEPEKDVEGDKTGRATQLAGARLQAIWAHLRARGRRAEVLHADLPHHARLTVLSAALLLVRVLAAAPPGGAVRARERAQPTPVPTGKKEPKPKPKEAKPPAGKSPVAPEGEPEVETPEQRLQRMWGDKVAVVQRLGCAAVLYGRAGQHKHAYNVMEFAFAVSRLFFGPIAGDAALPGSAHKEMMAALEKVPGGVPGAVLAQDTSGPVPPPLPVANLMVPPQQHNSSRSASVSQVPLCLASCLRPGPGVP